MISSIAVQRCQRHFQQGFELLGQVGCLIMRPLLEPAIDQEGD